MSGKPYRPRPEWAEHVRRLVDQAPPLSPAQISKLAALLQTQPAPAPRKKPTNESEAA